MTLQNDVRDEEGEKSRDGRRKGPLTRLRWKEKKEREEEDAIGEKKKKKKALRSLPQKNPKGRWDKNLMSTKTGGTCTDISFSILAVRGHALSWRPWWWWRRWWLHLYIIIGVYLSLSLSLSLSPSLSLSLSLSLSFPPPPTPTPMSGSEADFPWTCFGLLRSQAAKRAPSPPSSSTMPRTCQKPLRGVGTKTFVM